MSIQTSTTRWVTGLKATAQSGLWFSAFLGLGTLSGIVAPHPPLVAFAAIAGATLKPKRAVVAALSVWLINQIYGFGIRHYPQNAEAWGWGITMAMGTLLITLLVSTRPWFNPISVKRYYLELAIALVAGFALFEGLIMSLGFLLTGSHIFTAEMLGRLLTKELLWAGGLAIVHAAVVGFGRSVERELS
jgi:hypothetical protein